MNRRKGELFPSLVRTKASYPNENALFASTYKLPPLSIAKTVKSPSKPPGHSFESGSWVLPCEQIQFEYVVITKSVAREDDCIRGNIGLREREISTNSRGIHGGA